MMSSSPLPHKKACKLPAKEPKLKWTSDKAYIDMMVKDHEKDLAEFKEEASSGSDPDVEKVLRMTQPKWSRASGLGKRVQGKAQMT